MTMRKFHFLAVALVAVLFNCAMVSAADGGQTADHKLAKSDAALIADGAAKADDQLKGYNATDEKELRSQAAEYAAAFARADAAALSAMWTADGSFTDADGRQFQGQAAIQKFFESCFKGGGGQRLEITIDSLRFPAPTVAIEEGQARAVGDGTAQSQTKYLVVHEKKDGKWLMKAVSETACRREPDTIQDLSWLVGSWTAQKGGNSVHLKADWDTNHHFIKCAYGNGGTDKSNDQLQIIGLNPRSKQIIDWHFDCRGGIGLGTMSRKGNDWLEVARSAQPDGTMAGASYIFHKVNDNQFTWRSVNRSVGTELLPDTDEIIVSRDLSAQ